MVENLPHMQVAGDIGGDFNPRSFDNVGKIPRLSFNDVRINSPILTPNLNQPHITGPELVNANQPHLRAPDFNGRDIRITSPLPDFPVEDIRISAPLNVPVPGLNQAQAGPTASGHAVNGNPVFSIGTGAFTPGAVTSSITGLGGETIVDWTLVDQSGAGAISFLPGGNTLAFSGSDDFTVLNRILPTDATRGIRFDGNGTSRIFDAAIAREGGDVWFYSPGGIIVGGNARFDVGSLVLTTNAIDTSGGLFGLGGEIRFRGGVASGAITIEPFLTGSPGTDQINANKFLGGDSYVALVAPRVVQGGTVSVNGSAAYVGAEQADLTINNGLFDISIGVGTTDANGVVHSGTTTGPASTSAADGQAIYMVAVPKNAALTMLVGGNIGYQAATTAGIVNGNVVLSAGYTDINVAGTASNPEVEVNTGSGVVPSANIEFGSVNLGATTQAFADDAIDAQVSGSQVLQMGSDVNGGYDLSLTAANSIDFGGLAGGEIIATGNVNLVARAPNVGVDAVGGDINISSQGATGLNGRVTIAGDLVVDTSADALDDFIAGGDAVAGDIIVSVSDGGILSVGGNTSLLSDSDPGFGSVMQGFSQAGDITVNLSGVGSAINLTGNLTLNAEARNAVNGFNVSQIGNDSFGGDIALNLQAGSLTTGAITANSGGTGSTGRGAAVQSNDGFAGDVAIAITGGIHQFASLNISAQALANDTAVDAAGEDVPGVSNDPLVSIGISGAGSNLTIADGLTIIQYKQRLGVESTGGGVSISVQDTGAGSGLILSGVSGPTDINIESIGDASLTADNGDISFGNLDIITAETRNGLFLTGINRNDPDDPTSDINIGALNGGAITAVSITLDASAAAITSVGQIATGGDIAVTADEGSIVVSSLSLNSGAKTTNGTAVGGNIELTVVGDVASLDLGTVDLTSNTLVNFPGNDQNREDFNGKKGVSSGGDITVNLLGGTFDADALLLSTNAKGAVPGTVPGRFIGPAEDIGGDGVAGDIMFNLNGATATIDTLTLSANGEGGDALFGGTPQPFGDSGGDGTGGNIAFNATSGTLNVTNDVNLSATGIGGQGSNTSRAIGRNGGSATGGTIVVDFGEFVTVNAPTAAFILNASGTGGSAGNEVGGPFFVGGLGGDGTGGSATVNIGSDLIDFQSYAVQASGAGGNGGLGFDGGQAGNGTGGTAAINVISAAMADLAGPTLIAQGTGGSGGAASGSGGSGGAGGAGIGGTARLEAKVDSLVLITETLNLIADGIGGNGSAGIGEFTGATAGSGGAGGTGTGGLIEIMVREGGLIDADFFGPAPTPTSDLIPVMLNLSSAGTGGAGGAGGDTDLAMPGTSGDGGAGGQGSGGSVTLFAELSAIFALDINVALDGAGGSGGIGGSNGVIIDGASGVGGLGAGGAAKFEVKDGDIALGDVVVTASAFSSGDTTTASGGGGRMETINRHRPINLEARSVTDIR